MEQSQHKGTLNIYIEKVIIYSILWPSGIHNSDCSAMAPYVIGAHVLPVRVRMMNTENISGYSARMPGAFMDMY